MPNLLDIRRRIKSVKNTQQITKAMKMVSAAKLKRAQDRVVTARPFANKMIEVLGELAKRTDEDFIILYSTFAKINATSSYSLLPIKACAELSTPTSLKPRSLLCEIMPTRQLS
jgi:ATP synthase F1 gamma subunit